MEIKERKDMDSTYTGSFFLFSEMSKIEKGCLRRESSKNMEVLQNLYGTA